MQRAYSSTANSGNGGSVTLDLSLSNLESLGYLVSTDGPFTTAAYETAISSYMSAEGVVDSVSITGGTTLTFTAGTYTDPITSKTVVDSTMETTGSFIVDPLNSSSEYGQAVAKGNATTGLDVYQTGSMIFSGSDGSLVSPSAPITITFSGLADGAADMAINWQMRDSSGSSYLTQTSASSSTSGTTQNGYAAGEYESIAINSTGIVKATYSNGQTQNIAQLGIATVANEQGLLSIGSTQYQTTASSGAASIGVAGSGGRGTIEGSSLEASNVNVSQEFASLIVAQRAFEANSKSITTFDTITSDTINLIRG